MLLRVLCLAGLGLALPASPGADADFDIDAHFSRYILGKLFYYNGTSQRTPHGDRLVYGRRGRVVGYSDDFLLMRFPGNKDTVPCKVNSVSPGPPPPLPDGYLVGDTVFLNATSKFFEEDRAVLYGAWGEVTGPAPPGHSASISVRFSGSTKSDHNSTVVALSSISREPPQRLPGGYSAGDGVYFVGASYDFMAKVAEAAGQLDDTASAIMSAMAGGELMSHILGIFAADYRLVHGAHGQVAGPSDDGLGLKVRFSWQTRIDHYSLAELSRDHPPPNIGEQLYVVGSSKALQRKLLYGMRGEVVGPADSARHAREVLEDPEARFPASIVHEGVALHFPNNSTIDCYFADLSSGPPPPLQGGFSVGERLHYTGPSGIFTDVRLAHSARVMVAGPAASVFQLNVLLPGKESVMKPVSLDYLSRDPPPTLPGGLVLHEELYYNGTSTTTFMLSNFGEFEPQQLVYGQRGKVSGFADDQLADAVEMRFGSLRIDCRVDELSRTPPLLPGGYSIGDHIYFNGTSVYFDDGDQLVTPPSSLPPLKRLGPP